MARAHKKNTPVYALLLVVAVQFIALGSLLVSGAGTAAVPPAETAAKEEPAPEEMPAWLTPAEPKPEPEPEPVREKEPPAGERSAREILGGTQIVAHGMGAVETVSVLNCLEGFQQMYDQGVRVFEVDLRLTRDMQVVLRHDWRGGWQEGISEEAVPTLEEFLAAPILDGCTPMSFRDLLLLMEEHQDICVITDTKFVDAEIVTVQFAAMLADARELGLSYLFDRMAIQVYSDLMFQVVDSIHHFPHYIYTLYTAGFGRTEDAFREVADFCVEKGIMGVTMWDYWWEEGYAPLARERGLMTFVHTVNDPAEARALLASGITAIYTDDLTPGALAEDGQENSDEEHTEKGEQINGTDGEDPVQ